MKKILVVMFALILSISSVSAYYSIVSLDVSEIKIAGTTTSYLQGDGSSEIYVATSCGSSSMGAQNIGGLDVSLSPSTSAVDLTSGTGYHLCVELTEVYLGGSLVSCQLPTATGTTSATYGFITNGAICSSYPRVYLGSSNTPDALTFDFPFIA